MNMNGTYCSAPVVERVKCNERNYTNFKLAEYAVKNYSWFFIDDKYETRRFNDSFNSIIYSGKRYIEAMDKYMYVLSEVVYNILIILLPLFPSYIYVLYTRSVIPQSLKQVQYIPKVSKLLKYTRK